MSHVSHSVRDNKDDSPDAMSVFHVYEVPVWVPKFSRAGELGELPGRILEEG